MNTTYSTIEEITIDTTCTIIPIGCESIALSTTKREAIGIALIVVGVVLLLRAS